MTPRADMGDINGFSAIELFSNVANSITPQILGPIELIVGE